MLSRRLVRGEIIRTKSQSNHLLPHLDAQTGEDVPLSGINFEFNATGPLVGLKASHIIPGSFDRTGHGAIESLLRNEDTSSQPELFTKQPVLIRIPRRFLNRPVEVVE